MALAEPGKPNNNAFVCFLRAVKCQMPNVKFDKYQIIKARLALPLDSDS